MKYTVRGDVIVNSRGDVMAHLLYDKWETKNDEVLEFIAELEEPAKVRKEVKKAVVKKKKRARTKDGTYKADDPSTPDVNEAWEE